MLGQVSGERELEIFDMGHSELLSGYNTQGIIRLVRPGESLLDDPAAAAGDSGAPCFYKVSDSIYELVCIVFATRGRYAYAFPASKAQSLLGITFGKRAPRAKAMASKVTARYGATVMLTGAASLDLDEDPLTYKWELAPSVGGPVTIENAGTAIASFVAPSQDARR